MKAVIIGGTVSAMEAALHLRNTGHDVMLAVSPTFLGEDFYRNLGILSACKAGRWEKAPEKPPVRVSPE